MKRLFLLFFPLILLATVNEPVRLEWSSGYRNDRLHWHLKQPGEGGVVTYSELYRDVQFWENGLAMKTIYRDLAFCLKGSYAAFGRGTLFQRYDDLTFTTDRLSFDFDTDGWAADGMGYLGYAVNLTPDRTYKVILIPLIGYSGHFEQLFGRNGTPNPYVSEGGASFTMSSSLPESLYQVWYGVFFGGAFQFQSSDRLTLQAGYSYHLMKAQLKTMRQTQVTLFDAEGAVTSDIGTTTKIKSPHAGNIGQTGWMQIDSILSKHWRLGIGAQIHYFTTKVADATLTSTSTASPSTTTTSEKLKARWTPISGWVQTAWVF